MPQHELGKMVENKINCQMAQTFKRTENDRLKQIKMEHS